MFRQLTRVVNADKTVQKSAGLNESFQVSMRESWIENLGENEGGERGSTLQALFARNLSAGPYYYKFFHYRTL